MKLKVVFLSIFITIMLSSCSPTPKVYNLGFIGTLSGPYAEVGLAEMYGAELAIEEINENGGINGYEIKLHIRDDEADSTTAVAMQNELNELGIDIIIGHSLSVVAIEAVANANEKNILLLSPSIGTGELTGIDDNLIRNVADVKDESEFITTKIIENPSFNKVLMIYNTDNLVLTQYHKNAFIDIMNTEGYSESNYISFPFATGNETQKNQILSYLDSGDFDTLFIASSNLDAAGFVNYTKVNDIDIDIHLTSWAATGLIENIDNTNTDNIYAYINFDDFNTTSKYLKFTESYEEKFAKEVNMLSVNGYDMIYVLKEAVESISSFDYLEVKNEILNISTFTGINSSFTLDSYGDCKRVHIQLIIEDGEYKKNE